MMMFWIAFVICWFVSILLIVAFMYGSSERRQCEHLRCLTSPPHYCIDCGMQVSEKQALQEDDGGWDSLFEYEYEDGREGKRWRDPFTYEDWRKR